MEVVSEIVIILFVVIWLWVFSIQLLLLILLLLFRLFHHQCPLLLSRLIQYLLSQPWSRL